MEAIPQKSIANSIAISIAIFNHPANSNVM